MGRLESHSGAILSISTADAKLFQGRGGEGRALGVMISLFLNGSDAETGERVGAVCRRIFAECGVSIVCFVKRKGRAFIRISSCGE